VQFQRDIEDCLRKPLLIRKLEEPRKTEVIKFIRMFRYKWHFFRQDLFQESKKWLVNHKEIK
jgi:hypothetical protein